ncbi:MAG: DUF2794 domain-containing protein [Rhodobacteraceae bacterium]|nr:DUF2794 domain-containing protein [Paracoccaceae bacterium]
MRIYDLSAYRKTRTAKPKTAAKGLVRFSRIELRIIMAVYSRNIAAGTWRDYGLSCLSDRAVFSVYRNSAGRPLYLIEKLIGYRGACRYRIRNHTGEIIKRGENLARLVEGLGQSSMYLVS